MGRKRKTKKVWINFEEPIILRPNSPAGAILFILHAVHIATKIDWGNSPPADQQKTEDADFTIINPEAKQLPPSNSTK